MALMTWGEFKAAIEAAGVEDGSEIFYIDITYPYSGEELTIQITEDGLIVVD